MGFFSAAVEGSRPATFEGVLRLAAPTPTRFAEFVGSGLPNYGLIAEDVAEIDPILAVRGRDGQIESVPIQRDQRHVA